MMLRIREDIVKQIAFASVEARNGFEATKVGNVVFAPRAVRLSNSRKMLEMCESYEHRGVLLTLQYLAHGNFVDCLEPQHSHDFLIHRHEAHEQPRTVAVLKLLLQSEPLDLPPELLEPDMRILHVALPVVVDFQARKEDAHFQIQPKDLSPRVQIGARAE